MRPALVAPSQGRISEQDSSRRRLKNRILILASCKPAFVAHLLPWALHLKTKAHQGHKMPGGEGSPEFFVITLTIFFDLSNIRFESGGPVQMFGASQCFRFFQSDGPPALAAVAPVARNRYIPIQKALKQFCGATESSRRLAQTRGDHRVSEANGLRPEGLSYSIPVNDLGGK